MAARWSTTTGSTWRLRATTPFGTSGKRTSGLVRRSPAAPSELPPVRTGRPAIRWLLGTRGGDRDRRDPARRPCAAVRLDHPGAGRRHAADRREGGRPPAGPPRGPVVSPGYGLETSTSPAP